jgi:Leucine Rich repeat
MQAAADTALVEAQIQRSLADDSSSSTELLISGYVSYGRKATYPSLTVNDICRIFDCAQENHDKFDALRINDFSIHRNAPTVLSVFRNRLPLCTSITAVILMQMEFYNHELELLLPAFYNTGITRLSFCDNEIGGKGGGDALRDLLIGNRNLIELFLCFNPIGPEGSVGLGHGLAGNNRGCSWLQKLTLYSCKIGNAGLANLVLSMSGDGGGEDANDSSNRSSNNSLKYLDLGFNDIEGAEGGRHISLLLQRCFPALETLHMNINRLFGPLGARAMAPGLAAARHLARLEISDCRLGIDGVANLVPDANRSLTSLRLGAGVIHKGGVGGDIVLALAARCTNLQRLDTDDPYNLSRHQLRHLKLLFARKRLVARASALAGSTFPVLFRFVEEQAHRHEQGLGAIFVILQNDGDDHFYTALNRAMA